MMTARFRTPSRPHPDARDSDQQVGRLLHARLVLVVIGCSHQHADYLLAVHSPVVCWKSPEQTAVTGLQPGGGHQLPASLSRCAASAALARSRAASAASR